MLILQRETLKYNKEISKEAEKIVNEDDDENFTETNASTENKRVKINHSLRLWNCSRLRAKLYLRTKVIILNYF